MEFARGCKDEESNKKGATERITREEIRKLYDLPLPDLLYRAQTVHREHWDPLAVQVSILVSVKTGACPEDCSYCTQSSKYKTDTKFQPMMSVEEVMKRARAAKAAGATRLCMGASGTRVIDGPQFDAVLEMVRQVKALDMETCVTLGMMNDDQARRLKEAGLDYYNHNLDTSPEFYSHIITTRTYKDRLDTIACVQRAGIRVCTGGILGMGETREDRVGLLHTMANLEQPPESVSINHLMRMPGTPLENIEPLDDLEFVRTIAAARIIMPKSRVRVSAGRIDMTPEMQLLCFMAGAGAIFAGEKLLTADNPGSSNDYAMLKSFGMKVEVKPFQAEEA